MDSVCEYSPSSVPISRVELGSNGQRQRGNSDGKGLSASVTRAVGGLHSEIKRPGNRRGAGEHTGGTERQAGRQRAGANRPSIAGSAATGGEGLRRIG